MRTSNHPRAPRGKRFCFRQILETGRLITARTELLVIDESTTRRGFADQVRWNQVFYRVAQGL